MIVFVTNKIMIYIYSLKLIIVPNNIKIIKFRINYITSKRDKLAKYKANNMNRKLYINSNKKIVCFIIGKT